MLRHLAFLVALVAAPLPALGQSIVTSPVELVDNSPQTPGLVVVNAKTTPQAAKGSTLYPCEGGGPPWRYSVGAPCPAPVIEATIAAPQITAACKDLGASAQWTYAGKGGTYGNACLLRALDAVPLDGATDEPRVFQDVTLASSRHFITQRTTAWRPFANVTVQRVDVTARKRGINLRGGSHDWLIQDVRIRGAGVNTSPGDIPVGIGMAGATNIVIRRADVGGFKTELSGSGYANADCISAERGDSFTAANVYVHDCTDGGFDTKANTRLYDVTAENIGHYSLRAWAYGEATTFTSINPGGAHIQMAAASADWHIDKLVAVGGKALVHVDSKGIGSHIVIKACDLSKWTGTALFSGFYKRATITVGASCALK